MVKVAVFYLIFTPLSTIFGDWLQGVGWDGYVIEIVVMILNFVLEFLYQRFFVFKDSIDSAVPSIKVEADSEDAIIVDKV
jgi:hypothetical protein